ncbi:MAG: DUF4388 domain-containing protein [Thermoleophilia bacterium]
MSASGSLETLRLAELLQVAALFKKMGSIRLQFPGQRVITVYLNDGALSGLSDSGRVWQLGDLLASMGRIDAIDKQRLLTESTTRGKRLGQLLVDQHYITKSEMEQVLRRLILQSLLFAVENESTGVWLRRAMRRTPSEVSPIGRCRFSPMSMGKRVPWT